MYVSFVFLLKFDFFLITNFDFHNYLGSFLIQFILRFQQSLPFCSDFDRKFLDLDTLICKIAWLIFWCLTFDLISANVCLRNDLICQMMKLHRQTQNFQIREDFATYYIFPIFDISDDLRDLIFPNLLS